MNQAPATKPQPAPTREISAEQFEQEFQPTMSSDGERYKMLDCRKMDAKLLTYHDLTAAYALARLWTIVENDDEQAIVSGQHKVNRIAYVVTEQPHNGADIVVPLT